MRDYLLPSLSTFYLSLDSKIEAHNSNIISTSKLYNSQNSEDFNEISTAVGGFNLENGTVFAFETEKWPGRYLVTKVTVKDDDLDLKTYTFTRRNTTMGSLKLYWDCGANTGQNKYDPMREGTLSARNMRWNSGMTIMFMTDCLADAAH